MDNLPTDEIIIDPNYKLKYPEFNDFQLFGTKKHPFIICQMIIPYLNITKIKFDKFKLHTEYECIKTIYKGQPRMTNAFTKKGFRKAVYMYESENTDKLLDFINPLLELSDDELRLANEKIAKLEKMVIDSTEALKDAFKPDNSKEQIMQLNNEVHRLHQQLRMRKTNKDLKSDEFINEFKAQECNKIYVDFKQYNHNLNYDEVDMDTDYQFSLCDKYTHIKSVFKLPFFIPKTKKAKDIHAFLCNNGTGVVISKPGAKEKIYSANKYETTLDHLNDLLDQFIYETYVKLTDKSIKNNMIVDEYDDEKPIRRKPKYIQESSGKVSNFSLPYEPSVDELSMTAIFMRMANE